MISWDAYEKEYIFDHGFLIGEGGILQITKKQWDKLSYIGTSIRNPDIKTLMLPSIHGSCLIFEHKHFEIVEEA
jgi:hypothetical protein